MGLSGEEYNYLDRRLAEEIAGILYDYWSSAPEKPLRPEPEADIGTPNLVDSIEEAPLRIINDCGTRDFVVYAVDGGSAVLARGGNIEVIAWRAGRVEFAGARRLSEKCRSPRLLACNRLAAEDYLKEFPAATRAKYTGSRPVTRLVDHLRWLAEWEMVEEAIDEAAEESLILIDGSLRANISFGIEFQKSILEQAVSKRVHVAAVTKQTSLTLGDNVPLDLISGEAGYSGGGQGWFRRISRSHDEDSGWLGDIYLAKLHPRADKPYRIDLNRFDEESPAKVLSMIASISDDIEFCGYPYALAAAHRLARIDNLFRREISEAIGHALRDREVSPHIWRHMIEDFHGRLNADISESQIYV